MSVTLADHPRTVACAVVYETLVWGADTTSGSGLPAVVPLSLFLAALDPLCLES